MHAFAIMLAIGVQFGLGCMILYLSHLEQIQWAARSPLNFLQGIYIALPIIEDCTVLIGLA